MVRQSLLQNKSKDIHLLTENINVKWFYYIIIVKEAKQDNRSS